MMLATQMMADDAWWRWLCLGGAAVLIGIAKAGFGGGVGIIAVPLTVVALPADRAIGVMLPLLIVGDVFSIVHHRGRQSRPHVRWLLGGFIVGVAAGTGVLAAYQHAGAFNDLLNLTIGGLSLLFVVVQGYRLVGGSFPHIPATAWAGRVVGAIAGLTSTITHAAGPIVSVYLLEQKMDKHRLVATAVYYFLFGNLLKVPTYLGLKILTLSALGQSLWLMPLVAAGTVAGAWMHQRVPEKPFAAVIYLGTAVTAGWMIYKAAG